MKEKKNYKIEVKISFACRTVVYNKRSTCFSPTTEKDILLHGSYFYYDSMYILISEFIPIYLCRTDFKFKRSKAGFDNKRKILLRYTKNEVNTSKTNLLLNLFQRNLNYKCPLSADTK